jgi:uncharacterized protein YbjT (DUF2867 family)
MFLVTGASGMSGTLIIEEFVRNRVPVRALVRSKEKAAQFSQFEGVETVVGDMLRPETLDIALAEVHHALMISSPNELMVETQCSFVDAAKRAGVRRIVKFSGAESGIGFNPSKFRFTRMHEEIEDYLEISGMAWTHLRPSQFMQVYLREVPTIVKRGAIYLPLGDIKLSPIDVEDVAKVAFQVLTSPGHEEKSYEMTGPEALTMHDVAERISRAVGQSIEYAHISPEDRHAALLNAGVPASFVEALDEQTEERRKHPESRIDTGILKTLGIRPTTFLEFAIRNASLFRGATV